MSSIANPTVLFGRTILCGHHAVLAGKAADLMDGQSAYFCNVHMLMLSRTDPGLADAMGAADFVFPDGVPVAWLQRRLGRKEAGVLRGYEAMEVICERAARSGETIGLLGATDEVLAALGNRLQNRFPGLRIVFAHAPPMMEEDAPVNADLANAVNAAAPDFLFVGLGCPKQEKWIHRHRAHIRCAMLGVGAAFGWLSETMPRPPGWMERVGLGWLYRLVREPRRMARRYLVYNTQFILASAKLLLFGPKPPLETSDQ